MNIVPGENQPLFFHVPLGGKQELTISVLNAAADLRSNAVFWDLTLTEANAGQKLAARIHRLLGGG
ncbi:hypothetical protein D3C71_2175910 [compost metagenome]